MERESELDSLQKRKNVLGRAGAASALLLFGSGLGTLAVKELLPVFFVSIPPYLALAALNLNMERAIADLKESLQSKK